jgi:MFS family permease
VLGTFYLWGGISVYCASYLRSYDSSITISLVKMVFPFMNVAINAMLSFGVKLADKIGHRLLLLLGVLMISLSVFICSFLTSFIAFLCVYAIMVGFSSGLMYMVPVVCGWKYFPEHKGRVSGMIVAGYGFGSFMFNFIAIALVNPDNITPGIKIDGAKYFVESVYSNVPFMFRILSLCYLILGLIGVFLVRMPDSISTIFV